MTTHTTQRKKMWSAAVILLLWAADKHLLSKVWALMNSVGWSAITVYSKWRHRDRQDMVKEGYHVDFVYLYEPVDENATQFNEIDLLGPFRQHIQETTFTNSKSIPLSQFIHSCLKPNSNFNSFNPEHKYELVVHYTFDYKKYVVVYTDKIRFPLYTESEIRKRSLKKGGVLTAGLLTAEEEDDDGIDIYDHLKKLAGPMENFYIDTEFDVKRHYLNYAGLRMNTSNSYIKMLDFWGNSSVIKPDETTIKFE